MSGPDDGESSSMWENTRTVTRLAEKYPDGRVTGMFTLEAGTDVFGDLKLNGPLTSLELRHAEFFATHRIPDKGPEEIMQWKWNECRWSDDPQMVAQGIQMAPSSIARSYVRKVGEAMKGTT